MINDWVLRIASGLTLFIVAVPFSLGIAHSSGAPALAGLISAAIGGILVGFISKSSFSVSGPAAGLTAIVYAGILHFGSYEAFLPSVILAGLLQVLLSFLKVKSVTRYIPSAVSKGLLVAIGLTLIFKQVPHLMGYDIELFGSEAFTENVLTIDETYTEPFEKEDNTFTVLAHTVNHVHFEALFLGLLSMGIYFLVSKKFFNKKKKLFLINPYFVSIFVVSVLSYVLNRYLSFFNMDLHHYVQVPYETTIFNFASKYQSPMWASLLTKDCYWYALAIAFVSTLESILSTELSERITITKESTFTNRELIAQGVGNMVCGLLGGLPVASSISRTTVNIAAGAKDKLSGIIQGFLMLVLLVWVPKGLTYIPLAVLAAILVIIGFEISYKILKEEFKRGWQTKHIPLVITICAILFSNFVVGTLIGLVAASLYILWESSVSTSIHLTDYSLRKKITFGEDVTFFHKGRLSEILDSIQSPAIVEFDGSKSQFIDSDIIDMLKFYRQKVQHKNIEVIIAGIKGISAYTEDSYKNMKQDYQNLLKNNAEWVQERLNQDPHFFEKSSEGQTPQFLFIGCSDSRVPVNMITKTDPGDIFVHRNIANVVSLTDMNLLSVLQYSVEVLNVRHIIVCGHYHCGGVKAAISHKALGMIDNWITQIKNVWNDHETELESIQDEKEREKRLVELHVIEQSKNLLKTSIVQMTQKKYGFPFVHSWVYDLSTGKIKDLEFQNNEKHALGKVYTYES